MLPDIKVDAFYLLLRLVHAVRDHLGLYRRVFGEVQRLHETANAVPAENPDDVVLQGKEELRRTGVSLSAGAPTKLVVYAARFVPLRPYHVESAETADFFGLLRLRRVSPENNVHSPARHVRRDRVRALAPCLRDDLRLALIVFRVQYLVAHPFAREERGKPLVVVYGRRADEQGLPPLAPLLYLLGDRLVLRLHRLVDAVGGILAYHLLVRRYQYDLEAVHLVEFLRGGLRRAGHSRDLLVHPEVVLDG